MKHTNAFKKLNNAGFTLIETLIVWMLVCSFVLLPTIAFKHWQTSLEKVFFYYRFEKSILHLQQVAIADHRGTRIDLYNNSQLIIFFTNHTTLPWKSLKIPPAIKLESSHAILFKAGTGNSSTTQPGNGSIPKIVFTDAGKRITYQFQLGSGRFEKK
ncbi:competence type IV pilus minor pilin ComGD [Enterococcus dongliensis]|uniref:Competence type IV pilus minor pilin ComGD n=1 Tax=Enterococcus dongliensis TaxID=2559925 RepID=A0AAP5KQR7_9ENTE|nr:competence type IV pilus minor pilin ComGD [Enterococcus dongliensis]MDT2596283.1 competence type IV pilus minor pilin ComGD [Enterococcus dongliensis]MDT2604324.1 competence type IV pilus minor pilin ComGD [Enterococcus dongliensis]MDT2634798.1 competence type IV pilus minor pilin ComGD [Enterococcus dongliensis]MDT2637905.1 competence type IV pilus minor pilin ComGD [Enterococcus dongliensis]MDT2642857.1 competence type IV pilus minor pilin ComGD [Enterococcus dongliensis]